jgi:hypothetical protein
VLTPSLPELRIVQSRLAPASWERRVEAARLSAKALGSVLAETEAGSSLNQAIELKLPASRRSWVLRWLPRFRAYGVEGLIDRRLPRESSMTEEVRTAIADVYHEQPDVTVDSVVDQLLGKGVVCLPSRDRIERELAAARARGQRKRVVPEEKPVEEVLDLSFAGGELLLAAEVETGAVTALTKEIVALGQEAREASAGREPERDRADRDDKGRFTAQYNEKRKREEGEVIAPYLRTAEEKAAGRVPSWPRFVHEQEHTIHAKGMTLVFEPLVSRIQGWDGLRSSEAAGLAPLTGFAYMPSTLAKFTSALAISGAGPRLLDAAGKVWHEVAQQRWGEGGAMAALYVDNNVKGVWSSLLTQAAKVSKLNRVMPAITTSYVHTGAGTPLVLGVQSGSAPLAPKLATFIESAEQALGGEIERAVVIDSEGSTFDILESFSRDQRVIVTPLRPARAAELEIRYGRGSYYRPYRDNDMLRSANATLIHRSSGRSLEIGVLLIRRSHRDEDFTLLTTGLALGMTGRDLADLYFARWPLQENWFKAGEAVGLANHRGNCGRMVANIAVVTESEHLEHRLVTERAQLAEATEQAKTLIPEVVEARRAHERAQRTVARHRATVDKFITQGDAKGAAFAKAAVKHHAALTGEEQSRKMLDRMEKKASHNETRREKLEASIAKAEARATHLEPQKQIRQLDVALDMILTATKVTALQLIMFVIREYLVGCAMTATTFIARLLTTRGRLIRRANEEIIIFYENPRDPEMGHMLRVAAERLNHRNIVRNGRSLRYTVESQPAHSLAPP